MAARKWVPIIVGVLIFVVLVGAGLIAAFAYVMSRQVQMVEVPTAEGQQEFERLLAQVAGQQPFLEVPEDLGGRIVVHRELESKDTGSVKNIHLRAWSERDRKFVRIDLPFWILRLGGNHPIRLDPGRRQIQLQVTPEEIDRRGPGLILNHTARSGERVLIWTD